MRTKRFCINAQKLDLRARFAHQQVQVGHMCLDVVSVVCFDFGEVLELRSGFRSQRLHEGSHPAETGVHAVPRQTWGDAGLD